MNAEQLMDLARDRPQVTRELHPPSAFYGHAEALKRHAGLPARSRPKVAIAHGVGLTSYVWDVDAGARVPTYLCASPGHAQRYSEVASPGRVAVPIGPMILYAPAGAAAPPGRTLVAFPAHSTHHVDAVYDVDRFAERLAGMRGDWDELRVCLYWRDVLRGAHRPYLERGFDCVTAGHIYDAGFLPRMRAILEGATTVISNEVGSFLFYAVALGRPVWLVDDDVSYRAESAEILRRDQADQDEWSGLSGAIRSAFSGRSDEPTADQLAIVEKHAGLSSHRTPAEMAALLAEAEQRYRDWAPPLRRARDRLAVAASGALSRASSLRAQRA